MKSTAFKSAPRRHARHWGFTFVEVVIATAMLSVLLATVGQLVVLVKRNARAAEHHAIALQTLENCLEEITNMPWDEIDDTSISSMQLSDEVRRRWPQAKLAGKVTSSSEPAEAKKVSLRLSPNPDVRAPSVALTTWVYRAPGR